MLTPNPGLFLFSKSFLHSLSAFLRPQSRWAKLSLTGLFLIACGALFCPEATAQSLTLDFGKGGENSGTLTGRYIQFVLMITILSLAPSILLMVTSFTRLIVVFSFLRSAIGLQQSPPNTVLVSLALFLTLFIMAPTFEEAYEKGFKPLMAETITEEEAFVKLSAPFHAFMRKNTREKEVELFAGIAKLPPVEKIEDIPLKVLVPAFMISELRRAFEIGFLLFLPFIIIDMVVASILMSMGMMMLPPMMISLPFKIIFFVLVDGWYLIVQSLMRGFT
jgi:flagellar biosynthetic protein FliP